MPMSVAGRIQRPASPVGQAQLCEPAIPSEGRHYRRPDRIRAKSHRGTEARQYKRAADTRAELRESAAGSRGRTALRWQGALARSRNKGTNEKPIADTVRDSAAQRKNSAAAGH